MGARLILPGVGLAGFLGFLAMLLTGMPPLAGRGISPLVLAIVLGMLLGNTILRVTPDRMAPGFGVAQKQLLRAGVAFFGLNISFQQIMALGWSIVWLDSVVIVLVMAASVLLGRFWLGMGRDMALLTGIGSAICGAAAVLAVAPLVRADAQKVAMAVATVVLFGTIAMFTYPLLFPYLGMTESEYGVYVGSTVHEVAQVVAAGSAVSSEAAETGVIVKLVRVMLLAPTLIVLSLMIRDGDEETPVYIPWFVIGFIAVVAVNSLVSIPPALHAWLVRGDLFLLATAMAALGVNTRIEQMKALGPRALVLAALLFGILVGAGLILNRLFFVTGSA